MTDSGDLGDGIGTADTTYMSATEASICVNVSLVDEAGSVNGWYQADETETVLTFYEPSGQFVTGGGWIFDPDGGGNGKGNFSATARYLKNGKVQGNLVYIYRGIYNNEIVDFKIKSTALNALAFNGTEFPISVTIQGKAVIQINRASDGTELWSSGNATFLATLVDSNTNSGDSFGIVVYDKGGVVFKSVPLSTLQGGQVMAHP